MPVRPHLPGIQVFAPEDIAVLADAFEEALRALRLIDRRDPTVSVVAKRVIDLALGGERDPIRLRENVVKSFSS